MKPSRLESIVKAENPVHIFVLVHGTWAASAEWTKAGSKLVASLLRTAKSDIRIDAFIWWGRNSPKRRAYYAKELAKNLGNLREATLQHRCNGALHRQAESANKNPVSARHEVALVHKTNGSDRRRGSPN